MRWLRHVLTTLVALSIIALVLLWLALHRSLPEYDGDVSVSGVSGPVEIIRTQTAVPHVFAETDPDVFFGLGYAHAQDRIWQMEIFRRTAQGRLSELFGRKTLATDELLRRFDLLGAAESSLAVQDAYTRAALEAYAAGVNARLAETEGWAARAPELPLFPSKMEPWRPVDSIAILKLLALQLASHVDHEILRARVSRMVTPARLRDILPDDTNTGIEGWPSYSRVFPEFRSGRSDGRLRAETMHGSPMPAGPWASNAWAAAGGRSEAGAPLLANDTHLNFTAPSVWYLARLELASGGVIGGTIPGIPTVLSGRNSDLAWALTAANMDDQDVYIEKLNPDDPGAVQTPGGYRPLTSRKTSIAVRGEAAVEIELQWSENGPIIPGRYYNLEQITPPGHVAVIARTLFDPADTSLSSAHRLLQARSVSEAIAALETFVTPAQNLSMADRHSIALQVIGKMPRRQEGHETRGRMPSKGWVAENRWQGRLPYALNPRFVNPAGGVIGNTNSRTIDRPFPNHVSFDWGDTHRILRLKEILQGREKHSFASFQAAQSDAVSVPARTILALLLPSLEPKRATQEEAIDMLSAWDARMEASRPEPLIFSCWLRVLQTRIISDELGALAEEFGNLRPVFLERVLGDIEGASAWCDDIRTAAQETCPEIAIIALDAALTQIAERHGSDLSALRWGEVHQATHDHPVLGGIGVLAPFVNIRQPTGGGDFTLLRGLTRGIGEAPLENVHGAVYRSIVDFSQAEASVFVNSTGQSGHPLSRHYRDHGRLWQTGQYVSMALDPDILRRNAAGTMRLVPE